jgi:hypothetical protein
MSSLRLVALDRPEVPPLAISARLRSQLVYFITPGGSPDVPALGEDEFWFAPDDVARSLDDGVVFLVSPLDTTNMTEVELSEEQEALLSWLQKNNVRHVRVEG